MADPVSPVGQYAPSPYVGQYGRVRMTPLMESVAAKNAAAAGVDTGGVPGTAQGTNVSGAGGNVAPAGGGGPPAGATTQGASPQDVAQAEQDASSGDQRAIDWLKTLQVGAGIVGGGIASYALYKALRNRAVGGAAGVSLDPSIDGATGPDVGGPRNITPHVTQLTDEQIIPRTAGYLGNGQKQLTHKPPTLTHATSSNSGPGAQVGVQGRKGPQLPGRDNPNANVPGPTQRQMQDDVSYQQRDYQNSAPKVATQRAIAERKRLRMQAADEALRAIGRRGR